ncbi:uncharacterized protein PG986_008906 [Apiospora aurea]|uniref:Uncharacterized protein n=1 Tax=Apiospora aurea TaxID=335848 RepID=A0ABR1Q674_9PEZI
MGVVDIRTLVVSEWAAVEHVRSCYSLAHMPNRLFWFLFDMMTDIGKDTFSRWPADCQYRTPNNPLWTYLHRISSIETVYTTPSTKRFVAALVTALAVATGAMAGPVAPGITTTPQVPAAHPSTTEDDAAPVAGRAGRSSTTTQQAP